MPNKLSAVAYSEDGTIVAVKYFGGLAICDASTHEVLEQLPAGGGAGGFYAFVATSPDGKSIAFPQSSTTIVVRNLQNGQERELVGHEQQVRWVAYSPDGSLLASAGLDGTVILWDLAAATKRTLEAFAEVVWSVAFSPDGQYVAAGTGSGKLIIWNIAAEPVTRSFESAVEMLVAPERPRSNCLWSVAFSPDGASVVAGCGDGTIRVWELASGGKRILCGHVDEVRTIAFSRDGHALASGSRDQSVKIWDWPDLSLREALKGHGSSVEGIAFSPDGQTIASAGIDYHVRFWNVHDRQEIAGLGLKGSPGSLSISADNTGTTVGFVDVSNRSAGSLSISADNRTLAVLQGTGRLLLCQLDSRTTPGTHVTLKPSGVSRFAVSSRDILAAACDNGEVWLWDLNDTSQSQLLSIPSQATITALTFSANGTTLALATAERDVSLWNIPEGRFRSQLPRREEVVTYLAWSPTEDLIAVGTLDGLITLWEVIATSPQQVGELKGLREYVNCMAFSPDGQTLAAADFGMSVKTWNVSSPQSEPKTVIDYSTGVSHLAFSPDGRTLFTAGSDRSVRLWDTATLQQRFRIRHPSAVDRMAVSPDGKMVASFHRYGRVQFFRAATPEEVKAAGW